MKILNLTNQYPSPKFPYKGSFIYNLLQEVANSDDVEVHVLAPNYERGADLTSYQDGNVHVHFFDPHVYPDQDPLLTKIFPGIRGKINMLRFLLSFRSKAFNLMKKYHYDLVHTHWLIPSGLVGNFLKIPQVNTSYGSDIMVLPQKRIWRGVIRRVLSKISFQFSIGEEIHDRSQKLGASSGEVTMPIPVSTKQYNYLMGVPLEKHGDQPVHIVTVASLYPLKNIKSLLFALEEIESKITVHIVGDGDEREKLEEQASRLPSNVEVIFHGFQSRESTLKLIAESHISVLPSYSEGISSFLVESLYAGNVIVASNVGGTPSIVQNHGFLHEPDDYIALRKFIAELVEDSQQRKLLADRGRRYAEEFLNPLQTAQRHVEVYQVIVGSTTHKSSKNDLH